MVTIYYIMRCHTFSDILILIHVPTPLGVSPFLSSCVVLPNLDFFGSKWLQFCLKTLNGNTCLGGCFKYFFIFTPTWGDDSIWLIFFKWVETTNQTSLEPKIVIQKLVTHHYWAGLWLPSTCGNEVSEDDLDSLTKEALLESKESLENMR